MKHLTGDEVWVYRNLRKNCLSVMQNGRVITRMGRVLLYDCRFVVRPAGHERVLRERRKNVHAFVVGRMAPREDYTWDDLPIALRYNPYEAAYFRDVADGRQVTGAQKVYVSITSGITASGVHYGQSQI